MSTALLLAGTAFSLGVHLLVVLALGLLTDGNAQVRAYRRFVAAAALWLAMLLLAELGVLPAVTRPLAGIVAHALPVIFLASDALPGRGVSREGRIGIVAIGALLLPFTVNESPWFDAGLEVAYYLIAWSVVAFRVVQAFRGRRRRELPLRGRAVIGWLMIGPATIGLFVAVGAVGAIPLVAAAIQAAVLHAVVRFSLYEVRAEASRTGALAADAAEQDRRAVVGEIAAMVAHEVRNPLTGIRSLAQRVAENEVDEERRRRYASVIVREVDRIEQMVGALLGATAPGREGASGASVSLDELFDDLGLLVSGRFRRAGVALAIERAGVSATAPREVLAQVLLNLLLNACAQAPSGTRVRLATRATSDGLLDILVEDRGPGIPPAERGTVFEPFRSGTGGSGLGLAVVRRLCDEAGWNVRITDTPGGGATFVVSLPLAPAETAASEPREAPPVPSAAGALRT